jgi:hypothetical protein
MFFLIFVITLASRSQARGSPDIWNDDINDLAWFGEYQGYPGFSYPYSVAPSQVQNPVPSAGAQILGVGAPIQQLAGHSILIWPSVNGEPPRVEQRPGIVTQSTLSL